MVSSLNVITLIQIIVVVSSVDIITCHYTRIDH